MKTIRLKVKVHYKKNNDTAKTSNDDVVDIKGDSINNHHLSETAIDRAQISNNISDDNMGSKSNFDRFVELVGDAIVSILGLSPLTISDESLKESVDNISIWIDRVYGLNTNIPTEQKLSDYCKDLSISPVDDLIRIGALTRDFLDKVKFVNDLTERVLVLNTAAESACYSIFKELVRLTESYDNHSSYKKLSAILLSRSFSSRMSYLNYLFESRDQSEDVFDRECIYGWFHKLFQLIGSEICEILNLSENTYTEYHYHKVYNMIHAVLVSEFPITMEFYREGDSRSPVEDITILNKLTLFYHITSPGDLCDSNLKYQNNGPGLAIYTIISDAFRSQIDSDTDGILGLLLKDPTHSKDPKLIRIALKAPKKNNC